MTTRTKPERFLTLENAAAAAPFVDAWERLANDPLERNVFTEPWFLLPALDHFAREEPARIGLALRSEELTGVFPFVRRAKWNGLPVPTVQGWVHSQAYLGTPLLHREAKKAKQAVDLFLSSCADGLVELEDVSGDGDFMRLLMEVVTERQFPWLLTNSTTRPILVPRASADEYMAAALDGDARRKLRSKEKGLASLGQVRTKTVETPSELDEWISLYLRLEKAGWKGTHGSALVDHPDARRYFETVVREGFRRGRVTAITLSSGERPVAVKINFKSGDEWFAYKIAYDEDFARYSPGLLLEVDNVRRMHSIPGARAMDSCTGPTTRVFRDLWLDRRAIHSVTIAVGREPASLFLAAVPLLRWGKRRIRELVPHLAQQRERKPAPRESAALPLASTVFLPKRLGASPLALAATALAGVRRRPGDLRVMLKHAVRLQCASMKTVDFHDYLDGFFGCLDTEELLSQLNYSAIRAELFASQDGSLVRRVGADCRAGTLVRLVASLSIRLDFELVRAGDHIPPHGHSRVVSGFSVVQGRVAVRRYDLVENEPDSVAIRPTFDGILSPGQASTESDARDNVHWIVALEDSVLFRLTASGVPSRRPIPTSLNLWIDPRSPMRGNGTILGRWIPEATARAIPPYTARTT
jgi:CelD/BcsL family acetyltransferase involved in cellulose biosynthesis